MGGGRWGGGGGRPQGGDSDNPQMTERRQTMQAFFEPAQEMTITDTTAEITLFEKDGAIRVLHADGEKHKTDNGNGDVKTRREKDKLVVETENAGGGKLTEVFSLSADGKELTNNLRLQGRFGNVDVRRVYDALPAE
jgi:hypothetical protein